MSQTAHAPAPLPTTAFINRELSWLAFNERVLEEAFDRDNPLLERLRFVTIYHTNLDEFFMIRVSGVKSQVDAHVDVLTPDGLSPRAQLHRISETVRAQLERVQRCLHEEVLPGLAEHGITISKYADLSLDERLVWDEWYRSKVHPVLTPLAVGPTRPFPFISNLSLNLALMVRSPDGEQRLARVKVPGTLPRLVPIRDEGDALEPPVQFVPIEQIISANLQTLFPGMEVGKPWVFRVTRDADFEIQEDEANDLLTTIEEEVRKRRFGEAIRLELEAGTPPDVRTALQRGLQIGDENTYAIEGILGVPALAKLCSIDVPQLKYPAFVPRTPEALGEDRDIFAAIREKPMILHHPFDSFSPVVEFIQRAATDPRVLAIKQTLYRTSGDSPVVHALEQAIENGKQVAAVVELKARFDEENNIVWARRLEEAGVHVIYGVPRLKTHSKLALVVRQERGTLRRYAHIGTGNYNPITARIYTDIGLLTANPELTADVAEVFNTLTGFSRPAGYRRLLVAPHYLKRQTLELIACEAANARAGKPAHIIAKCNAVTDRDVIAALYDASQAGVEVDLLVRGICSLVPGVEGLSETIRVRSVLGRFLEHSRVYWFRERGGAARVHRVCRLDGAQPDEAGRGAHAGPRPGSRALDARSLPRALPHREQPQPTHAARRQLCAATRRQAGSRRPPDVPGRAGLGSRPPPLPPGQRPCVPVPCDLRVQQHRVGRRRHEEETAPPASTRADRSGRTTRRRGSTG